MSKYDKIMNMEVLRRSRKKPKPGDIFVVGWDFILINRRLSKMCNFEFALSKNSAILYDVNLCEYRKP